MNQLACPACRRVFHIPRDFTARMIYCPDCGQAIALGRPGPAPVGYAAGGAEVRFAGFWIRFVASLVDSVVLIILGAMATLVVPILGPLALWLLYKSLGITYWNGQTLGKKACGIRVVNAHLGPCDFGQAILRTVAELISGFVFSLGYIWAAFDDRKQSWHDKLADTLHIYA